jgi:hypothetical protein
VTRAALHGSFPPEPLREYSLIADGERGAVSGPHGEIVWLCAPRWHDDPVFSELIGGGGAYSVTPEQRCVWGGFYEQGTLVWRHRWVTDDNRVIECRDALALPADPDGLVLLRRVLAVERDAHLRARLDARARFGREPMRDVRLEDGGVWTARTGDLHLRWSGAAEARHVGDRLELVFGVSNGAHRDLVLEVSRRPFDGPPPDAARLWEQTERSWREAMPSFQNSAAPRDTQHAYAVLRGLTSSRSGGMVAAATMSLPEKADGGRNYDYRYVWIRDQCYAGIAAASDGPHAQLHDAVRFVGARLLEDGADIVPAYLIDGGSVPDEESLDLPGYPGGTDIRGNHVTSQFQLDSLGEAMTLFAAAARHDALDKDGHRAAEVAVRAMRSRWQGPDAGIWELDDRWWTHSRLACVAGLRSYAEAVPGDGSADLVELAGVILAETTRRCRHPSGRWRRAADDDRIDAALLLPPVRGALPPDDPRTRATLDAVAQELADDCYVYRYPPEQGDPGDVEGAFLLCGFIRSLAQLQQGDTVGAWRSFERNRAACGPPGLLSEEFDVRQRQLRGNLPQAFVHALLLENSVRLGPHDREGS